MPLSTRPNNIEDSEHNQSKRREKIWIQKQESNYHENSTHQMLYELKVRSLPIRVSRQSFMEETTLKDW